MSTVTVFQNTLYGTPPGDMQKSQSGVILREVRNGNTQMGAKLGRIRNVLKDPNAGISDIQRAQADLLTADRAHTSLRGTGFDFKRRFNPALFKQWGDENNEKDLFILEDVEALSSSLSFSIDLKSDISELRAQLRKRSTEIKEGKSINDKKQQEALDQKQDDTGTGTGNVKTGISEGGSVKTDIDSNKEKSEVTARDTKSEGGNVSVGNSNANTTKVLGGSANVSQDDISAVFNQITGTGQTTSEDAQVGGGTINRDGITYPNAFFNDIITKPNPLLQFAHYTYRIGLYLQTPNQYTNMMLTGNKDISQLSKILESGGTGAKADGDKAIFPDLYIDDLEIQSLMMGNTSGAHNAVDVNFNIIEPMGFRFLDQLRQLCTDKDMYGFSQQHYLMVITFTGMDEDGAELTPDNIESMTKYIPFKFSRITTTVRTGATQYACQAVPPAYAIGQSIKRSKIRFNVELAGRTLNDIFNAKGGDPRTDATAPREDPPTDSSSYSAYAIRNAASIKASKNSGGVPPLSTQGVIEALNKEQTQLVKNGVQSLADIFKVTFMNNIGNEKVVKNQALQRVKSNTPMDSKTTQAKEATQNTGIDVTIEKFASVAGMSVMQFIDTMLRASSYITKQQNFTFDEKTMKLVPSSKSEETFLQWFNIATVATPIDWDEKRNDYAYNIEFVVSPKKINDVYSSYFNQAKFKGTHKKYNYWFTGENTEIIDFEQELNASFYVAMDNLAETKVEENTTAETTKSSEGDDGTGKYGEPANRAAGILYSPVDFARSIMTIFGDPDFIQQNELFFRPGELFDAFMPDGSVNTESNEVLYEIFFRTQNDYNDNTGMAELQTPELVAKRLIYRLIRATTRFSKGQITQELEGLIREFADLHGKAKVEREGVALGQGQFGPRRKPKTELTSSYTQDLTDITDRRYPGGSTVKRQKISVLGDGSSNYNASPLGTNNNDNASPMGTDDDPRLSVTSNYNQRNADQQSYQPVNNRVNRKQDTEIVKPKSIRDNVFGDLGGA